MTPGAARCYRAWMPARDSLNVSLTPELIAWIAAQVTSGRYRSASEVVRTAIRLLQDRSDGADMLLVAEKIEVRS